MQHRESVYKILFFAVLALVAAALPVHAQETDDVIRTETSLVQLNVGVVDKQGRPITSQDVSLHVAADILDGAVPHGAEPN